MTRQDPSSFPEKRTPDVSRLYYNEFKWSPEGILQQKSTMIRHRPSDEHDVGVRTVWVHVYVDGKLVTKD